MIDNLIKYILLTCNFTYCNPLNIIFFCVKEKKNNIYNNNMLNKLKYIKKSVEYIIPTNFKYFNDTNECNIQTNFSLEKCCNNNNCKIKLMPYITWYCYNGHTYCSTECRTQYIKVIEMENENN